jgi:hypothetical protein
MLMIERWHRSARVRDRLNLGGNFIKRTTTVGTSSVR